MSTKRPKRRSADDYGPVRAYLKSLNRTMDDHDLRLNAVARSFAQSRLSLKRLKLGFAQLRSMQASCARILGASHATK